MKAIIIGAGRGRRLNHLTDERPKCLVEVAGRPILAWILEALGAGGVSDVVYIGGYRIDDVRRAYPELRYIENAEWPNNNILMSLLYAEAEMDEPFLTSYADILYRPEHVQRLLQGRAEADIRLVMDTDWRTRYAHRSEHPETDAEKATWDESGRVTRVHRDIAPADAPGEFIGLAYFNTQGAARLREHYHRVAAGAAWGGPPLERAYLIHLLQEMVAAGERMVVTPLPGEYIEVDTNQDFDYAQERWGQAPPEGWA